MNASSLNLMPAMLLLGSAQGMFLSFVLIRMRTGARTANRFLALLLLLFSIGLVDGFLSLTYSYLLYPAWIGIYWPLKFAYGPLVYFYVKSLAVPCEKLEKGKLVAHFMPVVLFVLYLIPFYLQDAGIKSRNWYFGNTQMRNYSIGIHPIEVAGIIQLTGYMVLSLRLLANHSKYVRQNFSSLENINLSWLRTIIIVFLCLVGMYTFVALFSQFYGIYEEAVYLNNLLVAVVIYVMGYKGIRQPEIFNIVNVALDVEDRMKTSSVERRPETVLRDVSSMQEASMTGKYKKSALTAEQSDKLLAALTKIMEYEKPYLEMGLTLPMLSNMLDVSPHHLSQMINENLKKSFFDFVNEYRVREAKKALISSDSERFSILGIAMDAGFNSKSAFYTAFKKDTGMTPSQYKKSNKKPAQSPAQLL